VVTKFVRLDPIPSDAYIVSLTTGPVAEAWKKAH